MYQQQKGYKVTLQQLLDSISEQVDVDPNKVKVRVLDENGYAYHGVEVDFERAPLFTDESTLWLKVEE